MAEPLVDRDPNAGNHGVVHYFRASGGGSTGPFQGLDLLLLTTVGARTGTPRTRPVAYLADGDRYVILADNAGRPAHPQWFHNLVAQPRATIEVGDLTLAVTATVARDSERVRLLAAISARYPEVADHQSRTDRVIPVVILTPEGS